jgi:hypothetical protein
MSKECRFLIYCLEIYRSSKNLTGKQVMDLFKQYRVTDYIIAYYESLHTTGRQYTIDDIDLYIESRQSV